VGAVKECLSALHTVDDAAGGATMSELMAEIDEACDALLHAAAAPEPDADDAKTDAAARLKRLYSSPDSMRVHPRLFLAVSLLVDESSLVNGGLPAVSQSGVVPKLVRLINAYVAHHHL
jgi:hypothetical protein